MWVSPQFELTFTVEGRGDFKWIVSGQDPLDALCRILRWNGINNYRVLPYVPGQDIKQVSS